MLKPPQRQLIHELRHSGQSHRCIAKLLGLSRNTVRKVLQEGIERPVPITPNQSSELLEQVKGLFGRCRGNVIRIQEVLKEEYDQVLAYSTLTRLVREAELRQPRQRAGHYLFKPGEEMQQDTSPHSLLLGEKKVKAQCASLVLAYSRKLFMQYYPCFTRFEAKHFLKEAFLFMGGSTPRCIIDNTSVMVASGSGSEAIMSPQMIAFGRVFSTEFRAHRVGHADRKARVERPFRYIETNFLAGRSFQDWDDLNAQARHWCVEVANKKEKRALGMSPQAAFVQEQPYLLALPAAIPPIYEHYQRRVDQSGYVVLDTNKYSVPDKWIGKQVDVYKYLSEVKILRQHQEIACHRRVIDKRFQCVKQKGHHSPLQRGTPRPPCEAENTLRGHSELWDWYLDGLKKKVRGRGVRQFNRLLCLKRTYPKEALTAALVQAQHYGLYDLNRLEDLIIKYAASHYFNLTEESFNERGD